MSSDLERISDGKVAWRRSQAHRPVEEKLALLEKLRDRAQVIRVAARRGQKSGAEAKDVPSS